MKRLMMVCLMIAFCLSGCRKEVQTDTTIAANEENKEISDEIIDIKEKMFVTQTNDIYINTEEYLGKTIRYEGMFNQYYWAEADETYYSVIRYGPGCCGYDQNAGFEIKWDGEYPKPNDWVEVVGVLEQYVEEGITYLRVDVQSLKVLEVRGMETVLQ